MSGEKRRFFTSIRFKNTLAIVIFIALLMMVVNGIISGLVRNTILSESLEKGISIASNLAVISEEAILTQDDTALFVPLSKSVRESRGISYAFVTDNSGNIIAHNDVSRVDSIYKVPKAINELPVKENYRAISFDKEGVLTYDISTVVGGKEKLGHVHLGIASFIIDEAVEKTSRNFIVMTLLGLFAGGLGAYIIATLQVKPILKLAEGVRSIGEGKLDSRINIKRKDEIGDLTSAFNQMAEGLQEKEYIRKTFQKFVHKDIANEILKNPDMVKVGGERKRATIVFTDVRSFTTMSENHRPMEVIEILNDYFAELLPIIDRNLGVLDKFMGDAMMIVFGTPLPKADDAFRAVKTGIEMRDAVRELNQEREKEGKKTLILGVGLNTGNVVAGNVGSEERMEYTVLGDAVNVAARIEGQSRTGEVLISEETYQEVKDHVVVSDSVEEVMLKGKTEPIRIYTVEKLL